MSEGVESQGREREPAWEAGLGEGEEKPGREKGPPCESPKSCCTAVTVSCFEPALSSQPPSALAHNIPAASTQPSPELELTQVSCPVLGSPRCAACWAPVTSPACTGHPSAHPVSGGAC